MTENLTKLEDPFLEEDENVLIDILDVWGVIMFFVEIIVSVLSVGASIFLIYVMIKFKQLRTEINKYFLHYSAANIYSFLSTPIFKILFSIIMPSEPLRHYLFCIVFVCETLSLILDYLFATASVVHWYLQQYRPDILTKYPKIKQRSVLIIYFVGIISSVISSDTCFITVFNVFRQHLVISLYMLCLLIVLVFNYVHRQRDDGLGNKTKYVFTIGTFIIMGWIPVAIAHFAYLVLVENFISSIMLRAAYTFVFEILITFSEMIPFIVVILLGHLNTKFCKAYNIVFRRSRKSYSNDDMDSEECEIENSQINNVTNL